MYGTSIRIGFLSDTTTLHAFRTAHASGYNYPIEIGRLNCCAYEISSSWANIRIAINQRTGYLRMFCNFNGLSVTVASFEDHLCFVDALEGRNFDSDAFEIV
jgi:hypothetical protein